jgi:hypothetical protein
MTASCCVPCCSLSDYVLIDRSFRVGNVDNAILHVAAVLDPVSEQAQRWSSLLQVGDPPLRISPSTEVHEQTVASMEHVALSVYLEPTPSVTEVGHGRLDRVGAKHLTDQTQALLPVCASAKAQFRC